MEPKIGKGEVKLVEITPSDKWQDRLLCQLFIHRLPPIDPRPVTKPPLIPNFPIIRHTPPKPDIHYCTLGSEAVCLGCFMKFKVEETAGDSISWRETEPSSERSLLLPEDQLKLYRRRVFDVSKI